MPINPFKENSIIELEKKVIAKLQAKEYKDLKDIENLCTEGILIAEGADEKADVDFFKGVSNHCASDKKDKYLFCWDDVPENNTDFIKFLKDELKIDWVEKYLFCWDDVPENNVDFIKFLKDELKIEHINYSQLFGDSKNTQDTTIKKSENKKTITVAYENNLLLFNKEKNKISSNISGKIYEYILRGERGRLKIYKNAAISKDKNNRSINITDNNNLLVFKLNKSKKKVTLKTTDHKTYEYLLKEEEGKINIYKEKKDAIEFLKEAIKKEENFLFAHYVLGFIYNELNNYSDAKEEFIKCIEIDKNFADAYFDMGVALKNIGNLTEATNYFKKSLEFYEKTNYSRAIDANWWLKNIEGLKSGEMERSAEENVIDVIVEDLRDRKEKLFKYINEKENKFKNFVSAKKTITKDKNFVVVLRRWNSYTPALSSDIERRKGGGYFLSWEGHGIVIDPGFNFIENFFANGFNISDIDAIFLSHSHLDHTSDFESLMTLIFESNDNLPLEEKKQIELFLNFSSLNKFANLMSLDKSAVRKIYIIQPGITADLRDKYGFILSPTKAKHRELWGDEYSVGLIFDLIETNDKKKKFKLGMTIDTGYTNEIGAQFKECDILIAHIGSIKEKEFDLNLNLNERLYKNHLGLIGTTKIIKDSSPKLAVISEFGEELGSLRVDISKAIEGVVKDRRCKRCIPGDIGMKISLPDIKIRCDMCSNEKGEDVFVDMSEINAIYFPEEVPGDPGKLTYLCKKHF
ncbi:MAG: MBL fold metallo-hydrolase [Candidatus Altiarchaeum hamiconexum]|uniref:MBL fold metallo-hydrolase n=1 Tax=Candidatus Altarchaeum hamiconexum TaxID=1803513 RepID=A0A8J8CEJ4_9ARCH|nr:MBL fold metallo-hydrolase [Candidatus Altarchaeum hamiconexum]PIN66917.1 MAG: hypothetical protein COV98_05755 [Candidatus Altarchaeum sp. CG12_big_fil_rev_8_21_14_0_65_33_22]PIV27697.1 MAG: hypothetical protein COS36_04820 [Candidatus Altarchaeum sp. CG03_land_8_20_14_0_80_32_618]PIX48292.1 MAG: hypothetical protein COZ53_04565 [Candidatus Altarchaeum sp. CG_4_8_14_3_um_filter_33_2054]PIZ32226.1 MAG: hypothetical protein COY41_01425 [Candidatus Altarchaeum sp. CG_4_10_14_0_8_um_filter_32_8